METHGTVVRFLDEGRFREAFDALQRLSPSIRREPLVTLTEAELLVELGQLTEGVALIEESQKSLRDDAARSIAFRIMGQARFYQGNVTGSKQSFRKAVALVRTPPVRTDLHGAVLLARWRLFSKFDSALAGADFDELRRAVLRSGSAHHVTELHICVAEVEARKSSAHEALRHLEHAGRLLASYPNVWLEGMSYNHKSNVFAILGDLDNAIEFAHRAVNCTDISGHFRIRIAASINLAELLIAKGSFAQADAVLKRILGEVGSHVHLRAAALDALAKSHLARNDISRARERMREIIQLRRSRARDLTTDWDGLSEWFTRALLFEAEGRQRRVENLLRRGIARAVAVGDRVWESRMRVQMARLLAARDAMAAAAEIVQVFSSNPENAQTMAQLELARADALEAHGATPAGEEHRARAGRVAAALGIFIPAGGVDRIQGGAETTIETAKALDDALALVELAGYPHVLAHEAYALLGITGAATRRALVARGDAGIRIVAAHEWSEAEAVAAAREPGERLHVACGTHRDESWEIVADLRDTLNDRCTGVAIRKLVDTAVTLDRYRREEKQRTALWPPDTLETDGGLWVSEQMTELLSIARRIAPSDVTVLLTGETGTGKEVLARAIHRASGRAARPFVPFNCTAVPREMLGSQLFGYRKGAFTGANEAFDGVIRAAAGGTLFLDEIAEIGPELQPKLLRFLETHEVHGLGEAQPVKVDVRVIAATNADLDALVTEGKFREDLFYRLNVVRLRLPPLRERREEIPSLVDHYLRKAAEEQKKGRLTLDDETLEYLVLYSWPGNVRQLVNEVSRIVAYADPDSTVTPALLSPEIQTSRRTIRVHPGDEPEISIRLDQPLNDAIEMIERMMVLRALERAHGNYENAARLLGISRKGLFLKRRRWGMQRAS